MVLFMAMFSVVKNEKRALSLRKKELHTLKLDDDFGHGLMRTRYSRMTSLSTTSLVEPVLFKVWVKNSTDKAFQFRASCNRKEAYSSDDLSGFNRVGKGKTWAYTYVQVRDPERCLVYIKIVSEDGRYFWDVTTSAHHERSFEVFWNDKKATYALRPMDTRK